MLYPKKNLIKGFSSYVPNGVFIQQMYEEYRVLAKSTNPTTSNGYWLVDVKPFTDYTFSMDRPSNMDIGVFSADATKVIGAYVTVGNVSFNSGANSQVRCYVKGANPNEVYELGKPMLKEGGSDIFEPFQLTNKRAAVRKDVIAPDIQGTSHNFVSGNVYKIKQDVRLTRAKFESLTAGSFNVAIYEWVEGTGKVGNPLFMRDANYGTGVYSYDFGGIVLKAGKQYFIGRYEQTNAAAIKRVTGATINVGDYVEWVGGTTLSQTTIIYPTSYYSFFAIEFELVKSAVMQPKKNMLKDIESINTSPLWITELNTTVVKTGEKFQDKDVYRITYKADKNGRIFQYFDTKGIHSAGLWIRFIQYDTSLVLTLREINFGVSAGLVSANQNIPDWQYIKFENANISTDKSYMFALYKSSGATTKDIIVDIAMPQLERNSIATNFEPYQLVNKRAVMYPTINLINPDLSKWVQGSVDSAGNITAGSNRLVLKERVNMSPNTKYTVKVKNGYRVFMRNFSEQTTEISNSGWVTDGYTFTTASNIRTSMFLVARSDDTNLPVDEILKASPMLAKGDLTENIPYVPANKPAVLYPQKNIVNLDPSVWVQGSISSTGNEFTTTTAIRTSGFIPVKPGTMYAQSIINNSSKTVVYYYNIDKQFISTPNTFFRNNNFTTPANCIFMKIVLMNDDSAIPIAPSDAGIKNIIQIEEGTQTPFEPYRLGNKRA